MAKWAMYLLVIVGLIVVEIFWHVAFGRSLVLLGIGMLIVSAIAIDMASGVFGLNRIDEQRTRDSELKTPEQPQPPSDRGSAVEPLTISVAMGGYGKGLAAPICIEVEGESSLVECLSEGTKDDNYRKHKKIISASEDNQQVLSFMIYQRVRDSAQKETLLGTVQISGIEEARKGTPKICLCFRYNYSELELTAYAGVDCIYDSMNSDLKDSRSLSLNFLPSAEYAAEAKRVHDIRLQFYPTSTRPFWLDSREFTSG